MIFYLTHEYYGITFNYNIDQNTMVSMVSEYNPNLKLKGMSPFLHLIDCMNRNWKIKEIK